MPEKEVNGDYATDLIESAFKRLHSTKGFTARVNQKQLAEMLRDGIADGQSMMLEAPTGIGKSLAALIPAIAHGFFGKRIVIATYTNILAEQYLRKDLPFALSLFEDEFARRATHETEPEDATKSDNSSNSMMGEIPKTQFLIGRQRYLCPLALTEKDANLYPKISKTLGAGLESDFMTASKPFVPDFDQRHKLWMNVSAPPVCAAKECPFYEECPYYSARRKAQVSNVVITNHSVVVADALMKAEEKIADTSEGEPEDSKAEGMEFVPVQIEKSSEGLLGHFDYLIIDEAHDFPLAAFNGLEFLLGQPQIEFLLRMAGQIESVIKKYLKGSNNEAEMVQIVSAFRDRMKDSSNSLSRLADVYPFGGTLFVNPLEWEEYQGLKNSILVEARQEASILCEQTAIACNMFVQGTNRLIRLVNDQSLYGAREAITLSEQIKNYLTMMETIEAGCQRLQKPTEGTITHLGTERIGDKRTAFLRNDVVDLASCLKELIWEKCKWACVSATLAVDLQFEYFCHLTGAPIVTSEIFSSPFDYQSRAALYLPAKGRVTDPIIARNSPLAGEYYATLAREIEQLILAMNGRTLVLFHSRKEMEAVYERLKLPPQFPVLLQGYGSPRTIGKQFLDSINTSLFGVRSFWTGFDAPGETLACVILVRIPFEVPVTPPQLARMAMLVKNEKNPFTDHALPQAKMMLRQGAGRLLRTQGDWGVIALLDPRVYTKRYGEEILENMPPGMRKFNSVDELSHEWIGLFDEPR